MREVLINTLVHFQIALVNISKATEVSCLSIWRHLSLILSKVRKPLPQRDIELTQNRKIISQDLSPCDLTRTSVDLDSSKGHKQE